MMSCRHVTISLELEMLLEIGDYKVDSILGLVQAILQSGEFVPAPDKAVAEGETIVGVLNDQDKAVYTAHSLVVDVFDEAALAANISDGVMEKARVVALDRWREVLKGLFWEALSAKYFERTFAFGPGSIAIRAGYQVVLSPPEESPIEALVRALFGGAGMDEEGHNCDICPVFDECPLPFKKERKEQPTVN